MCAKTSTEPWLRYGAAAVVFAVAAPACAVTCEEVNHLDQSFTVCTVVATENLRLFHADAGGEIIGGFTGIERLHGPLSFAMNAGMYHADRRPVGLYIEDGTQTADLVTREGPGNFGLLPNGVLCLNDGRADVIEALTYQQTQPECRHATQSGPMLVIEGDLHPRFLENSPSRYIRNGVGTDETGQTAYFAISNERVNFHDFATLFRDHLKTPNALYFDGNISRLYAPQISRDDVGVTLGPMIGVLAPE